MARPSNPDDSGNPDPSPIPSRRLTLLVEQAEDGTLVDPVTWEEFILGCQNETSVRRLFDHACKCQQERDDKIDQLDQEIKALKDRIRSKDEAITDLVEERDRYKDAFAQQALSRASPAPESSKKSSKIADPLILIDSKDLTFENWLSLIQDKLAVNIDHYLTPAI